MIYFLVGYFMTVNCSLFIPSDYKKPETCNPVFKK